MSSTAPHQDDETTQETPEKSQSLAPTTTTDSIACATCGSTHSADPGDPCPDCGDYWCPRTGTAAEQADAPADGNGDTAAVCGQTYETLRGMKTHYKRAHGVSYPPTVECAECGEAFDYDTNHPDKKYCSEDCAYRSRRESERITIRCEYCLDRFEYAAHENRRFCSHDCAYAAKRNQLTCDHCGETFTGRQKRRYCSVECSQDARRGEPRTTRCETCETTFEHDPSKDRRFCSPDCYYDSLRNTVTCDHCGGTFNGGQARRYCSQSCAIEAQTTRPDPENRYQYLYVLYVVEDYSISETTRRYPGTYSESTIRKWLINNGLHTSQKKLTNKLEKLGERGEADQYFSDSARSSNFPAASEAAGGDD